MTAHLFSSNRARALYQETIAEQLEPNARSYSQLERIHRSMMDRLMNPERPLEPDAREALVFAMADIVDAKARLHGGENPLDAHPEKAAVGHVRALEAAQEELAQAKKSGNPAWVEQATRELHGLRNATRIADGKKAEPYFRDDAERERFEEKQARGNLTVIKKEGEEP